MFIIPLVLLFFRVNARMPVFEENKNDKLKEHVLALLKKLPEIKSFFKYCPKEYEPALLVNRVPDSTFKYYWISAGIGNLGMFRTTYHFYIDAKTFKFYYLDFLDESGMGILPVEMWRKWRRNPGFHKNHKFRHGKLLVINYDEKKNTRKKGK